MAEPNAKVDPETRNILADLKAIVDRLNIPILLIGAMARVLVFDSQYAQGRATNDWDIAVQMDDWSRYEELVSRMTSGEMARFRKTDIIHKFIHLDTGLELDIIPFGNVSNENQEIIWKDGNKMSVLGIQEAFFKARIEKIDSIEIRVLQYPAFIGLKILAWDERRTPKDLADIIHVLQNYQDDPRIGEFYEEFYEEIETGQLELESVPSALLGRDMQTIFQARTLERIREILLQLLEQENQYKYFPEFIRVGLNGDWDEAFDLLVKHFRALQYGLDASTGMER